MKSIHDWRDFKSYGIHLLTGEADGIGIRLLCDLDPKGHALLSEYFGNTLTRDAERYWPVILEQLTWIMDKIEMTHHNNGRLLMARHALDKMIESCGPGAGALEHSRIGEVWNGPSQFDADADQRRGLWCSILLARHEFEPLAVFCLLHDCDVVVILPETSWSHRSIIGLSSDEYEHKKEKWQEMFKNEGGFRYYENSGTAGFRNRHEWTGRES